MFFKKNNKLKVEQVKKVFREQTHCGKYWGVEPKYFFFRGTVEILMGGNEHLVFNMKTQTGKRYDLDADGCSITVDFDFVIKEKDGKLKILRTN